MSRHPSTQQAVGTLNHVFMAYFIHMAEKYGVDFYNARPTENITKSMIGNYFVPNVDYAHMKAIHLGKVIFQDIDMEKLIHLGIEEFFDKDMQKQIDDAAKEFSYISEKYPHSDYIFSMLPDANPFIYQCDMDCDTNFTARSILGHDLLYNKTSMIFEFYCLFVERWRKTEDDPIYGEKYQTVGSMTPEEREKFDKQPEKELQDENF